MRKIRILEKYNKLIFYLTIAGVLFAGYLTFVKILSGACAFNESCPYFLGFPACFYGFGMFIIMFILSLLVLIKKTTVKPVNLIKGIFGVSIAGIFFSGYLTIQELFLFPCPEGFCEYALLLPTCAYGLIVYVAIFVISFMILRKK